MATPITVKYQETAFTLPWDDNRQRIHDRVYDIVLGGAHVPADQRTRKFLYDVTLLDKELGLSLVTVRASEFIDDIQSEEKQLVVQDGESMTVRARVSAVKRVSRTDRDKPYNLHRPVPKEELSTWAASMFARKGMETTEIKVLDETPLKVLKPKLSFGIDEVTVEAKVTVLSAQEFVRAFFSGMGRHKAYGLGMIEVVQ